MKQLDVSFIWLGKTLPVSGMNMYSGWPVCMNKAYWKII